MRTSGHEPQEQHVPRRSQKSTSTRSDPVSTRQPWWPDRIHAQFTRVGIRQVGYVPDAGHSRLIELCRNDPAIADVVLTTEEEGVGLVAGAALGGQRAALLMQSSGVGNCVNMVSLLRICGFPCLILVTMRGEYAEFNPWQVPMGSITEPALNLCGFLTYRVDDPDDVEDVVAAGCDMAFNGNLSVAILLSQRLIGRKHWSD
jgi:sulfopyruvate decarboxylase alpha subunit